MQALLVFICGRWAIKRGDFVINNTLQNAAYLACSWLWCLGGFLPLILARDYGWPALAAFTVFNVGGAMAMGFYFKTPKHQQSFETEHKGAIALFSYATIAYQLFFVAWLGAIIGQPLLLAAVLTIASVIYFTKRAITYWALAFYILSIFLFVDFIGRDWQPVDLSTSSYWPHAVLPLAIGFILSPYLDITFHRAYKNSHHPRLSFMLGFGVLFFSLIGFVFFYAGSLSDVFFNQSALSFLIYPIVAFLVLQTAFTVAAHCSELGSQGYVKPSIMAGAVTVLASAITLLLNFVHGSSIPWLDLPLEETVYKSFLFFYSLVFPLYLMLGKSKSMYLWVLALCTPAYSLGFLVTVQYSAALTIGVALVLAGGLIHRRKQVR